MAAIRKRAKAWAHEKGVWLEYLGGWFGNDDLPPLDVSQLISEEEFDKRVSFCKHIHKEIFADIMSEDLMLEIENEIDIIYKTGFVEKSPKQLSDDDLREMGIDLDGMEDFEIDFVRDLETDFKDRDTDSMLNKKKKKEKKPEVQELF